MEKIKHFIFKSRYVFTMLIALLTVSFSVLLIKVHAATSYSVDGYTFNKELSGDLPSTAGNYYLAHDYYFPDEDFMVTNTIRIYLNGHNIYTNGHRIIVDYGTLTIHDDHTNQTLYDISESNGKVTIGSGSKSIMGGYITGSGSNDLITVGGEYEGHLELIGGNIFDNDGCGVRIDKGYFYMKGGKVTGNRGRAGVYVNTNGLFEMDGGSVEYNYGSRGLAGGVYQYGTMRVNKSASVVNNKNGIKNSDVLLVNSKINVLGAFTGNIGIDSQITTALTSGFGQWNSSKRPEDYFFSNDSTKSIISTGSGSTLEAKFGTPSEQTHMHNTTTYTAWTYATSLPNIAGSYYLTKDVTLHNVWEVQDGIFNICLNGHSINLDGYYINMNKASTLKIYDCTSAVHHYHLDETGLGVVGSGGYSFNGGYIYGATNNRAINLTSSDKYKEFHLLGGAIIGNSAGAISFEYYKCKCYLYGGYVVGNTTQYAGEKNGSAVYGDDNGNLYLKNVTIENNRTYDKGSAIWILKTGTVTPYGESYVRLSGGNVIVYNNTNIIGESANLLYESGRRIYVDDKIDNSLIGIYVKTTVNNNYITANYGQNGNSYQNVDTYFKSDVPTEIISYGGTNYVDVTINSGHNHGSQSYIAQTLSSNFYSSINNNYYYYLGGDYVFRGDWTVPASTAGYTYTICLCGHKMDLNNYSIIVPANANLVIEDCSNRINRYYINDNGLAVIDRINGDKEFVGGYIFDSTSRPSNKSFFNITGGSLTLKNVSIIGANTTNGAINLSSGNGFLTMENNIIAGCKATSGAAINSSSTSNTTIRITNSKILYNTSTEKGGAINLYGAQLSIRNSDISYNKSTSSNGGAIYNSASYTTIYIYSSNLSHNESYYSGGALYLNSGSVYINDSNLSYNKGSNGGAIYSGAYLTLKNAVINYNEAKGTYGRGGGIYNTYNLYFDTYALIENNKAAEFNLTNNSGGAGLYNNKNIFLKGKVLIMNNYSSNNKGSNLLLGSASNDSHVYVNGSLTGSKIYVGSVDEGCKVTTDYSTYNSGIAASTYFYKDSEECTSMNATLVMHDGEVWIHSHNIVFQTISGKTNELKVTCSASGCDDSSFSNIVLTANDKTYDGATYVATIDVSTLESETGIVINPSITYTKKGYSTSVTPKAAGTYTAKAVFTYNGTNYTLTKDFSINKKAVDVTNIQVYDKKYDGTDTANFYIDDYMEIIGVVSGDNVTISEIIAHYDNKNAGTNKDVYVTEIIFGGTDGSNYTASETILSTVLKGNIGKKQITVTGITANNKIYDGNKTATLNTSNMVVEGVLSGDILTVDPSGNFNNKNVGDGKTIIISYTLTGQDSGNYGIKTTTSQETTTANITKKDLIFTGVTAIDKTYDGNTEVSLNTENMQVTGKVGNDAVGYTITGSFSDKNVGNKIVNIVFEINGSQAGNYKVSESSQATTTATIFQREITITKDIKANNKVYDGTTDAILDLSNVVFVGKIEDDIIIAEGTGVFDNKNVGDNKTVTISSIEFSGKDGSNYKLAETGNQTSTTANITAKKVTVSNIKVNNKSYDGTTYVYFSYLDVVIDGKINGDTLTVTAKGAYSDLNAGDDILVNITKIILAGADAANYEVSDDSQTVAYGHIGKITMYPTATNYTGTYDKNPHTIKVTESIEGSTITYSTSQYGPYSEEEITYVNVGTYIVYYKVEHVNYNTVSGYAKVIIDKKDVTVSGIIGISKIYDGNTTVELDYTNASFDGIISGDSLEIASANGTFNDKNVGTNKEVIISNLVLGGLSIDNYKLAFGYQISTTSSITPKEVTVSGIEANNKVYDGNTEASLKYENVQFTGLVSGDNLTVSATGEYSDANYGADKVVTISNIVLGGTDAANYILATTGNQESTYSSITKNIMNLTASNYEGTYDGSPHTITISGTPDGATIKYSTSENGNYNTDVISYTNAGTYTIYYLVECDNYEDVTGCEIVIINKKEVTVDYIRANDKTYDGTKDVTLNYEDVTIDGIINGDNLTVSATGIFDSKDADEDIVVYISNITLIGEVANNYILSEDCQTTTTANISKKEITISGIKANNKEVDGNTTATLDFSQVVYDGIVEGEVLEISASGSFSDALVENNKVVTISNLTLVGDYASNYILSSASQTEAIANITKLLMTEPTVSAYTGTYDKEAHTITITDILEGATVTYSNKENGEYSATELLFTNAGTYTIYYKIEKEDYETIYGSAKVVINKKQVTVSNILVSNKVYDGTTNATVNTENATISGIVSGDKVSVSCTGAFADKNVGENKIVNLTNMTINNSNYELSSNSQTTAKANITKKQVVISGIIAKDKHESAVDNVEFDYSEVTINGLVSGDNLTVSADGRFVDTTAGENKVIEITDLELNGEDSSNYEINVVESQKEATATIWKEGKHKSNAGIVVLIVVLAVVVLGAGAATTVVLFIKKKA